MSDPGILLAMLSPANHPAETIGWGSLALINAGLAQGKGRSGLNWFLLSLLFGPLATFCLVAFFEPLER